MLSKLKQALKRLKSVLIAFSGGVDSTFLLKVSQNTLGDNVLAVIAKSPTFPQDEVDFAKKFCEENQIKYQIIETDEFKDENFIQNSKDRCYYCKSELFSKLLKIAKKENIPHVLDGSNYDDKSDYRPGNQAKKELNIQSPLMDLGFTKQMIRDESKKLGLSTWEKPSYACLSSRIPYGTRITQEILSKVEAGEKFLKNLGFKQLRVRHHGNLVRIELEKPVLSEELMNQIYNEFKRLGYIYVTLDLKGYRTGSMNEIN